MLVRLHHAEDVAKNTKTFWFEPQRHFNYQAGQFIELYLPHSQIDERGEKHWFTLSSSPTEQLVSITTKQATGQISSFKQQLFALKLYDEVRISEPMGDFVLPKDPSIPMLFVAAGLGVTPVRSIVKWLTDTDQPRSLQLIYATRKENELAFLDVFASYGLQPVVLLSSRPKRWSGLSGHVTGDLILEHADRLPESLVYISGPEPMTERLERELLTHGFPASRLVLDFFPGYEPI